MQQTTKKERSKRERGRGKGEEDAKWGKKWDALLTPHEGNNRGKRFSRAEVEGRVKKETKKGSLQGNRNGKERGASEKSSESDGAKTAKIDALGKQKSECSAKKHKQPQMMEVRSREQELNKKSGDKKGTRDLSRLLERAPQKKTLRSTGGRKHKAGHLDWRQ